MDEYYTLGVWRAKEGREDDLVERWKEIGEAFNALPTPPGTGTLIRSIDDPGLFYSFGPWPSLEAIHEMRAFEPAREAIARMQEVCEEARPGTFRLVATVEGTGLMDAPGG
jgi:hypothetical protein